MYRVRSIARGSTIPRIVILVLTLAILATPSWAGGSRAIDPGGNAGNPRVFPPGSSPYGLSYGEWSVRWWQWAYGLPVAGHPLFDESGADCGAGQSGPVWFLGGVFNESGTADRSLCAVPSGKALFFPILDVEWDNLCPPNDPPLTIEELRATAAGFMDLATDLECDVDGTAIRNLTSYRFSAPPFGVEQPAGNIWEFFGCEAPAGHYEPLVPDGIFLMLAPLSPGPHRLHFRGTIGDPVNFSLEITYDLSVLPGNGSSVEDPMESGLEGSDLTGSPGPLDNSTTWGRMKASYR